MHHDERTTALEAMRFAKELFERLFPDDYRDSIAWQKLRHAISLLESGGNAA